MYPARVFGIAFRTREGSSMLHQLGQHISAARERARKCRERAVATADEALKAELIEMEKAWLELARVSRP
jgi:hypothetical protein